MALTELSKENSKGSSGQCLSLCEGPSSSPRLYFHLFLCKRPPVPFTLSPPARELRTRGHHMRAPSRAVPCHIHTHPEQYYKPSGGNDLPFLPTALPGAVLQQLTSVALKQLGGLKFHTPQQIQTGQLIRYHSPSAQRFVIPGK